MTNAIIIPPIGAITAAILLFVIIPAALIIKKCKTNSQESVKSKLEPVKKGNGEKIVAIVVLCLIVVTLLANFIGFWVLSSSYESKEDIYKGFDELVTEAKQKSANVDVSGLPETSLQMFADTQTVITAIHPHLEIVKPMNDYLNVINTQIAAVPSFKTFMNKLKQHAETKSCNLDVDWDSDTFKISNRLVNISAVVQKQKAAVEEYRQKLKKKTTEKLVTEEQKVLKHLELTKALVEYLQKHLQELIKIGAQKRDTEISPAELIIAIIVLSLATVITISISVFSIFVTIQYIRNGGSNFILTGLTAGVYITTCEIVVLSLLIFILGISGYVGKPCVSPISSDIFTMSSFDEKSTVYSDSIFNAGGNNKLLSILGPQILISSDSIIQDFQENQQQLVGSHVSEDINLLTSDWKKIRNLYDIMSNLAKERTCFNDVNQQTEINKYQNIFQKLVEGSETFGNSTIDINSMHNHMSAAFFEDLKETIETAVAPVNEKIKNSDFECSPISALHSKCAKLQCPNKYSYFDEALFHLIIVIIFSVILVFTVMRINKFTKIHTTDVETPSNPSSQNKETSKLSSSTSKQTISKPSVQEKNRKDETKNEAKAGTQKGEKGRRKNRKDKKKGNTDVSKTAKEGTLARTAKPARTTKGEDPPTVELAKTQRGNPFDEEFKDPESSDSTLKYVRSIRNDAGGDSFFKSFLNKIWFFY